MKRVNQATITAHQGRGGTRAVRLDQAIKSGVVQLQEPKGKTPGDAEAIKRFAETGVGAQNVYVPSRKI